MYGRTRGRLFFNFIANDNLRGVIGIELDDVWGLPRRDLAGAGCVEEEGAYGSASCGFRKNIDINNFELKQMYVDFRIPQLPFGNRTHVGGFPLSMTPPYNQIILCGD
jgi:hypothetical protein